MGFCVKNIRLTEKAKDVLGMLVNWLPEMRPDP
jgi:hypothetical protein